MARASGVAAEGLIEGDFTHGASGIHYKVVLKSGQGWMIYDRPVPGTGPELHGEQLLSYFIGSGGAARHICSRRRGCGLKLR